MNIFFYDVAISVPLRQCFTYSSNLKIEKGSRVLVPFGNRKVIGLVIKKSKEAIGNNIAILFPMASLDFLMTSPMTFLFPKGTRTRLPFSIFKLELYVKHCLRGTEMATS